MNNFIKYHSRADVLVQFFICQHFRKVTLILVSMRPESRLTLVYLKTILREKPYGRNALQEKNSTLFGPQTYREKPYTCFPDHGEKPYTSLQTVYSFSPEGLFSVHLKNLTCCVGVAAPLLTGLAGACVGEAAGDFLSAV